MPDANTLTFVEDRLWQCLIGYHKSAGNWSDMWVICCALDAWWLRLKWPGWGLWSGWDECENERVLLIARLSVWTQVLIDDRLYVCQKRLTLFISRYYKKIRTIMGEPLSEFDGPSALFSILWMREFSLSFLRVSWLVSLSREGVRPADALVDCSVVAIVVAVVFWVDVELCLMMDGFAEAEASCLSSWCRLIVFVRVTSWEMNNNKKCPIGILTKRDSHYQIDLSQHPWLG